MSHDRDRVAFVEQRCLVEMEDGQGKTEENFRPFEQEAIPDAQEGLEEEEEEKEAEKEAEKEEEGKREKWNRGTGEKGVRCSIQKTAQGQ